jgi:hypothetical protein
MDFEPIRIMKITSFLSKVTIKISWKWLNTKLLSSRTPSCSRHITKKLDCNNGGTGEGTWMANHRNNLIATKIRRQQGSQKVPTHYVLINHVNSPNKKNNQKNLQTAGRAEATNRWAKIISPLK